MAETRSLPGVSLAEIYHGSVLCFCSLFFFGGGEGWGQLRQLPGFCHLVGGVLLAQFGRFCGLCVRVDPFQASSGGSTRLLNSLATPVIVWIGGLGV